MFQPSEIAENLKRSGGYIPGVRPGKPTADFLDFTMTRLTFAGCHLPHHHLSFFRGSFPRCRVVSLARSYRSMVTSFFGGTSSADSCGCAARHDASGRNPPCCSATMMASSVKAKIKGRYDRLQNTGERASERRHYFTSGHGHCCTDRGCCLLLDLPREANSWTHFTLFFQSPGSLMAPRAFCFCSPQFERSSSLQKLFHTLHQRVRFP